MIAQELQWLFECQLKGKTIPKQPLSPEASKSPPANSYVSVLENIILVLPYYILFPVLAAVRGRTLS